ncbi:histone H1-like [Babylonia areolata]|uniref:histone H1-like n=1 Tax=Babylonia areolata TaxID=304850 RepID=UPI003FD6A1BA
MSDAAPVPAPAKKAAKPREPAKPAEHPKYNVMIAAAITSLKERGGSSRQAILKYIMANYKVGVEATKINAHLKLALRAGVKAGTLKQAKGTGASGSFRLGEKKVAAAKPKKTKKPKSPKKPVAKPKKPKSPKKPAAKKPAAKTKKPAAKTKKQPRKRPNQRRLPSLQQPRRQPRCEELQLSSPAFPFPTSPQALLRSSHA